MKQKKHMKDDLIDKIKFARRFLLGVNYIYFGHM